MEKPSPPPPLVNPRYTPNKCTSNPRARWLKQTMVVCMLDVCAVGYVLPRTVANAGTRDLAQLSLLCVSMGAICAALLLILSNMTQSTAQSWESEMAAPWQRWILFPMPALWAVCGVIFLLPLLLLQFCSMPVPQLTSTLFRTVATSVQLLAIVCIASILVSFRRLL